jgi:hypothetical protein
MRDRTVSTSQIKRIKARRGALCKTLRKNINILLSLINQIIGNSTDLPEIRGLFRGFAAKTRSVLRS